MISIQLHTQLMGVL